MDRHTYLTGMKAWAVLLVDDDEWVRSSLARYFRKVAGRFCALPNAEAALAQVDVAQWDVVLCDYQLPGVDGIAFLRRLAERGGQERAFLLTAHPEAEVLVEQAGLRVDGVIRKPLTIGAIERALAPAVGPAVSSRVGGGGRKSAGNDLASLALNLSAWGADR